MTTPHQACPPDSEPLLGLWIRPWVGAPRLLTFEELAFPDHSQRLVLGKSDSCDVWIAHDKLVSREHFELRHEPIEDDSHRVMLRDLDSTNGTIVNGVPVVEPLQLRAGFHIMFGRTLAITVDDQVRLPITAATYSSFLCNANDVHGSSRAAGAAIHRSHMTIRRAVLRRGE